MNGYNIVREVGRGGMGCVYEATDSAGRRVALKMMSAKAASHPDYREMFDLEVRSLRKLAHPCIVGIVGEPFSDESGNLFLPMEYVEGRTLAQVVREQGPFAEQQAVALFCRLLEVFSYIHHQACIHRDVKPSNIMLKPDNSICVIDFGIAKDAKTHTGKTVGRIIGTDGYMSPEQANGLNIDHRTDIYSLGCLFHFMLTGHHAIQKQSNDYATICAILESPFPLVSDSGIVVSQLTQQALLRGVDKNMTLRYRNCDEFREALAHGTGSADTAGTKVTVGRKNCDICMPGEYVSGHHLDIIWDRQGPATWLVTISDHSTNGTGVNGKRINHASYAFSVHGSPQSFLNNLSQFPQVMIAGLPTHMLDWAAVVRAAHGMDGPTTEPASSGTSTATRMPDNESTSSSSAGFLLIAICVVSAVIPPVGWCLYFALRDSYPHLVEKANKAATTGAIFYTLLIIKIVIR